MSDEVRKKIRLGTTGVVADSGLVNNANMAEHEAHVCICYKAQECMLKASEIKMSVDEVLALAKTIIKYKLGSLPLNKDVHTQSMLMARHQKSPNSSTKIFG